jgi:hypothetical protein
VDVHVGEPGSRKLVSERIATESQRAGGTSEVRLVASASVWAKIVRTGAATT